MSWQTIVSIILIAATGALVTISGQYGADKVPHWIPWTLAVLGAIGQALRGIGVTNIAAPKVEAPKAEVPK